MHYICSGKTLKKKNLTKKQNPKETNKTHSIFKNMEEGGNLQVLQQCKIWCTD